MIVTEKEARERMWCPFSRLANTAGAEYSNAAHSKHSHNRWGDSSAGTPVMGSHCIGDQCMAWKWFDPNVIDSSKSRKGYCGIAAFNGAGTP